MTHEEMNGRELLNEYKMAFDPKKYRINELPGASLVTAIQEVEKFHEVMEGGRPQNIAASIGYAVYEDMLFNDNGTIYGHEPK